jgi:hypothetical protein
MVIANGCQTDVLTQAEDMIQAYEFETAIELLDSLDISKKSEGRLRLLRAKAHLISGDRGFAYAELKFHDDYHSNSTNASAKVLLESANIISREKERSQEVVDILDSIIIRDVGLKNEALNIAWSRGIEYIDLIGDDGLRYFAFAAKHDPKVLGRLRGFNPQYARRYDELSKVDQLVKKLSLDLNFFIKRTGHNPKSISEIIDKNKLITGNYSRKGWDISLESIDDTLRVVAKANSKCPFEIPYSSRIISP